MKRIVTVGILAAIAVLAIVLLTACSTGGVKKTVDPTGGVTSVPGKVTKSVTIKDFAFTPSSVEVAVGGLVTWTNEDSAAHTVTGEGGIASPELAQGQSYTLPFGAAGTYKYSCSIHPTMTGTVVVK